MGRRRWCWMKGRNTRYKHVSKDFAVRGYVSWDWPIRTLPTPMVVLPPPPLVVVVVVVVVVIRCIPQSNC